MKNCSKNNEGGCRDNEDTIKVFSINAADCRIEDDLYPKEMFERYVEKVNPRVRQIVTKAGIDLMFDNSDGDGTLPYGLEYKGERLEGNGFIVGGRINDKRKAKNCFGKAFLSSFYMSSEPKANLTTLRKEISFWQEEDADGEEWAEMIG